MAMDKKKDGKKPEKKKFELFKKKEGTKKPAGNPFAKKKVSKK